MNVSFSDQVDLDQVGRSVKRKLPPIQISTVQWFSVNAANLYSNAVLLLFYIKNAYFFQSVNVPAHLQPVLLCW